MNWPTCCWHQREGLLRQGANILLGAQGCDRLLCKGASVICGGTQVDTKAKKKLAPRCHQRACLTHLKPVRIMRGFYGVTHFLEENIAHNSYLRLGEGCGGQFDANQGWEKVETNSWCEKWVWCLDSSYDCRSIISATIEVVASNVSLLYDVLIFSLGIDHWSICIEIIFSLWWINFNWFMIIDNFGQILNCLGLIYILRISL